MNCKGMDPKLYFAALRGSIEEILSIQSNCNNWWEQTTPMGNNVLHVHVGKPLEKKGKMVVDIKFIEKVLHHDVSVGYSLLWKENTDGDTPLHLAAMFGHAEAVREFLERAKAVSQAEVTRMLRVTNKKKDTALHEAARAGHVDVVEVVVEADRDFLHEANDAGETPLYLATERGSTALVAKIVDACAPPLVAYDHKGPCGRTALHAAVQLGNPAMVGKILEKQSSLIRVQDDEGLTPLHCAIAKNKSDNLEVLLSHDEKELESATYIQDNKGRTPLHIATLEYNLKAITKLIASRPDSIEVVDNKGQNVVHYAAKLGCVTKFRSFLKLGHFGKLINKKDVDGNTPLHLLATSLPFMGNHICIVSELRRLIREQPVEVKAFNNKNVTPGDILASDVSLWKNLHIQRKNVKASTRGRRIDKHGKYIDVEKATNVDDVAEKRIHAYKNAAQSQLVVATLIAKVSFTAGFTLPGGFNQNLGPNLGMAVLTNKPSFKTFLVSDTIAFICSSLAILLYFLLANKYNQFDVEHISVLAALLCSLSMGAMMIAFVTGVYAVVSRSPGLIFTVLALSLIFFLYYIYLLSGYFKLGLNYWTRCYCKNPRLRWKYLIPLKDIVETMC